MINFKKGNQFKIIEKYWGHQKFLNGTILEDQKETISRIRVKILYQEPDSSEVQTYTGYWELEQLTPLHTQLNEIKEQIQW